MWKKRMNQKTRLLWAAALAGLALVLFLSWSRGWFNRRPIDILDFSAQEVATLHIGYSHDLTHALPEITDKADVQRLIDGVNSFRHGGYRLADGDVAFGCILYSANFLLADGEEIQLTVTTDTPQDPRSDSDVEICYTLGSAPSGIASPIARGSLAFFYDIYDKYTPPAA